RPFMVWPQLVTRSVDVRLAQSGPMDIVTAGRYVDQVATALEFALERGILHRNLSAQCILLQLNGQAVVADFGVRGLAERLSDSAPSERFYGSIEACAPEQLAGGIVSPATDVYALGGVTYRLLTGRPLFEGSAPEMIIEQHLRAAPPSIDLGRTRFPSGLAQVLQRALAKDPQQRFARVGAFANAYQEVVTPNSATRIPFSDVPIGQGQLRVATAVPSGSVGAVVSSAPVGTVRPDGATSITATPDAPVGPSRPIGTAMPSGPAAPPWTTPTLLRGALALVLLMAVVFAGLFITGKGPFAGLGAATVKPVGSAEFVDNPAEAIGDSDALHVEVSKLGAPAAGSYYAVWMIDQRNERVTPIGKLVATGPQTYALQTEKIGSVQAGVNLIAAGDKLEVTEEHGAVQAPVGPVRLSGTFPPKTYIHIQHLLTRFPATPGNIGLVVGVLLQTRDLDAQAAILQNAFASHNALAVRCSAQSITDIIEGAQGGHYQPLPAACAAVNVTQAGDGFGLLGKSQNAGTGLSGYLDLAVDHASLAATQPDATAQIRLHAGHVETALANIKGWVTTADQDALALLSDPASVAASTDLLRVSDKAYHGNVGNSDQTINPTPAEGGGIIAYEHAQFMATLTLHAGS
ncbi:MAG TPA: protein kinase, partial [Ktedonobacterales bacterium]